ncbi:SAM-dependent methyltransferase [Pseudorhodoferax soli]|uniref:Methyltransferase family protein n=1 Tax=Pseudorhodoferax soli TaxID=545864 RepID=A0A368XKC9_9BURK|nr:class I SAM-dependent methyltransferase [Pseudorhodoferax soli]RCW67498.1 methyltransferase family protein [Pseudorhodoferax soli]
MTTIAQASLSRRLAVLSLAGFAASTFAQSNSSYEPQRGQAGKDVIWIPTPDETVTRMLQMAEVKPTDRVFDLGSGDGKIAIAAAREFGARATGLEYNPDMVGLSSRRAQQAGVADKVQFRQADIFQADFSSATVVTMYLLPALNLRLRPLLFKMAPGTRVVSHSFTMGDWTPDETARAGYGDVYLWHIPANASGNWKLSGTGLPDTTLALAQRYQVLSGDAGFGELRASLVRPRIVGAQIAFGLRDPKGQLWQFEGQVAGDRITGTATRPGQPGVPFEARRAGDASPIVPTTAAAEQDASAFAASTAR